MAKVITLFLLVFNSAWLAWVFLMLSIHGTLEISEPSRLVAISEFLLTLAVAILGIILMLRRQLWQKG